MGYAQFLAWVGKQALRNKVLQKYLNKAWREPEKAGKPIVEKNFPGLLKKAQDFKANFKTFEPKIVKPINVPEQTKNILNIKSTLKGRPVKVVKPKLKVEKSNVIPLFPKKPPTLKADGGRIDKALPKKSRDI
jgi:hypothetical protein